MARDTRSEFGKHSLPIEVMEGKTSSNEGPVYTTSNGGGGFYFTKFWLLSIRR